MARYDDAGRNLHWLEEELLADEEEACEEEFDEEYEDGDEEEEDWEEYREPVRPRRRRRPVPVSPGIYEDEAFDEDAAVLAPPEKRGVFKLLVLAVLEILAILAIVRWWIRWL